MSKRVSSKKPIIIISIISLLILGLAGTFFYIFCMEHSVEGPDQEKIDKTLSVVTRNKNKDTSKKFQVNGCLTSPITKDTKEAKQVTTLAYLKETASKTTTSFSDDSIKQLFSDSYITAKLNESVYKILNDKDYDGSYFKENFFGGKDAYTYLRKVLENSREINAQDVAKLFEETYGETLAHGSVIGEFEGYLYDKERDVYYTDNNITDILLDYGAKGCVVGDSYYVKDRYVQKSDEYYLYVTSYYLNDYVSKDGSYEDNKCGVYTDFEEEQQYNSIKKVNCRYAKDELIVDYTPDQEDLDKLPKYRFILKKNGENFNFIKLEKL